MTNQTVAAAKPKSIESHFTQIKIRSPRDLFSVVPYALGYQPEESILVVCIRRNGGLGLIARTSLSDLKDRQCCVEVGEMVAQSARRDEAGRAFIVIYCAATDEFTLHGYKKLAQGFVTALADVPCETWVINAERYYRVDCDGFGCCPPGGRPVSELLDTEASAALVYRGYAPARSREQYLHIPEPTEPASVAAHRAEKRFATEQHKTPATNTWRCKAFTTWQKALALTEHGKQVPPTTLGLLGAALTDTTMRDAVLLSCLPGGLAAARNIVENPGTAQLAASQLLGRVVGDDDELAPIPPPQLALHKATHLLEAIAGHVSERSKPGPLSLLAFLAWWAGDGTRASTRVQQALAIAPDYRLAITLAQALESRLQPGWIRSCYQDQAAA